MKFLIATDFFKLLRIGYILKLGILMKRARKKLKFGSLQGLHSHNSARNAMSGLMAPSVSTRKASGTGMSAIRPRHPLRTR